MAEKRPRTRATYHHGDLRAALVAAGITLARDGGPQAIVLREVARIVGVAPNSAYGHFATLTALKEAVAQRALGDMAEAMSAHLDVVDAEAPDDPQEAAKTYLIEVGRAYIHFALAEPGLFRTAMGGDPTGSYIPGAPDGQEADDQGRSKPDALLVRALDRLVAAGCLRPGDTARATMSSWAAVHGLSILFLDLLPHLTAEQQEAAIDDTLGVNLTGVTAPAFVRS
ncbi:TetR/AcrR family transcriptional regulator [Actinoplanes friuliensis]|uniref:TetR family transcriptional regulator n=1 Tax=Actinoplanes friuliensis DSM 7358 TaxID=1246995 RepID=U5VYX1_9ACTN|nr:TetR-like C-terminal domain-containing protein [Actinoplanes friuliensis]AGZ40930.1 TetR family transcriptional regulator [Actinoplanes friuliensis DSM 7358]